MTMIDLGILQDLLEAFKADHFFDVAQRFDSDDHCVDEMIDHVSVAIKKQEDKPLA